MNAQTKVAILCGRNTVQLRPAQLQALNWDWLESTLKNRGIVKRNAFLLSCEMPPYRLVFFQDGRVFVHGTSDILTAKKLYYSLIG